MNRTNARTGKQHRLLNLLVLALLFVAAATQAQAQTRAYVANTTANAVSVIDTGSGLVVKTIPVGINPSQVAITQDGARVYVANTGSNSLSVIDTATDQVRTIPVGDSPSNLAVTGDWVYVMTAGGVVQVVDGIVGTVATSIVVGGKSGGEIAITPDGTHAYVAAGAVSVIDTASQTLQTSFVPETAAIPNVYNFATSVAFAPDGKRAYVPFYTYDYSVGFSAGGGVAVVDTAKVGTSENPVFNTIDIGALPGSIALTPDGGRAYVGDVAIWVNTIYVAGFTTGRSVSAIDTATAAWMGVADLGSDGVSFDVQNTPAGIAVAPDRSSVYVSIPRINSVAVVDPNTNLVTRKVPGLIGPPDGLAIVPDPAAMLKPYVIDAVNDTPSAAVPAQSGQPAIANVLANDTLGGARATLANVTLSQVSSSNTGVALDTATGSVVVATGTPNGAYTLDYQICETAVPSSCDVATVALEVRSAFTVDAVNDGAVAHAGAIAVASILANDTVAGAPAISNNVTLSVTSPGDGALQLNLSDGSVFVVAGTSAGDHTLVYRICETASPANCDDATVTVTVVPFAIGAANDAGTSTRAGGTAVANVLTNDTFDGGPATLTRVTLSVVSSTNAGVTLNVADGSVSVAQGTPAGDHSLMYRVCETASPSNCAQASVTVTVNAYVVNAVNDQARASSKRPGTAVANVLANDTLGGAPATLANVTLSFVSLSPATNKIQLDLSDGSVDVLGKVSGGIYLLVYQICEIGSPTNCGRAAVTLDLSGGR